MAIGLTAFLLFRPDTLLTEVETDESLEAAFPSTTAADPRTSSASAPSATATTRAAEEPSQVSIGQLVGIGHSAEGTAAIYQQGGSYVLRLEDDTTIQNGPDLYVWLLASESYLDGTPTDYLDLGTLKGTVGGQNYTLPDTFDPNLHRTVLIWCLRFSVPFAAAPLR